MRRLPIKEALLWIVFSVFLVSGSAFVGVLYYFHHLELRKNDLSYQVVAIVQTGPYRDFFRTNYFAEILNLSIDKPVNLFSFDSIKGEMSLLQNPLFKGAKIRKMKPGTIIVDYVPRIPKAFINDLSNTGLDEEGVLFPFKPFFSPKKLPEIYLGKVSASLKWGDSLVKSEKGKFAMKVFAFVCKFSRELGISCKSLDLSRADETSLGKRQIVVRLEESDSESARHSWLLRLSPEGYEQELARYNVLREQMRSDDAFEEKAWLRVVDFRVPYVTFVEEL
jgi:hypothetical protein